MGKEKETGIRTQRVGDPGNEAFPLPMAREGQLLRVIGIRAGKALARRLQELGFTEECVITIVKRQPSGPLILQLNNSRFALGQGMAMKIMVVEASG